MEMTDAEIAAAGLGDGQFSSAEDFASLESNKRKDIMILRIGPKRLIQRWPAIGASR